MRILGLDIATHTGMVLLTGEEEETRCKAIQVNQKGFSRLQSIAGEVKRTIELWNPDFAVIEGYAFCRNVDSFITIVEVGTVIREMLYISSVPWVEVPPTVLKKWVSGEGTADKPTMAECAKQRWNFVSDNHDIVDAFGLAKMGQMGLEELRAFVAPKKRKKKRKKG